MPNQIVELWNEFYETPFPANHAAVEVEGIDLCSLDTFSAGCIDTFISGKGRLDQRRASILKNCLSDLDIVVKHLDGEASVYFARLQKLVDLVLTELR